MQTFEVFLPARCVREPAQALRDNRRMAQVEAHLAQLVSELGLAQASVVASVAALRHQNCEIDADIAQLLQRRVSDVIGVQIERTEELLAALSGESR